jgi:xanthine dehydrogenase accessory factor
MRDVLADYDSFAASGDRIGRAVVTDVFGSAPRPEGASMLATSDGRIAGSVSGGCVEAATAAAIGEAMARGTPELLRFSVTNEQAWEVGLSCGGTIEVFVEPWVRPELLAAARGRGGTVMATVVGGDGAPGAGRVVDEDASRLDDVLPPPGADPVASREALARFSSVAGPVAEAARRALAREASRTERLTAADGSTLAVFLEVFPRQPRLVVFGGVHVAVELVPLARALGYHTVVADGRRAFVTRERFPEADELLQAWPEEAFEKIGLDASTYVCVLSHDPKFDEPALRAALGSPAAYVGAIGSRKTQAGRRERLREAGFTDEQLERLRGPIGLDLGGRHPAETALAILAEMTAVRYGGSGRPMRELTSRTSGKG